MAGLIKNLDGSYTVTNATVNDLQADLQSSIGSGVTVIGHGVVGSTLPDLIAGTGSTQNFVQYLSTDTSQIFLENMGINDEAKESQSVFRQALVDFVTQTRQAGKVPVLEEPNPLCNPNEPPANNVEALDLGGQTIAAWVDIIDQVGAQMGVPVVHQYTLIKALPNWCAMMSDGWGHPTVALYAIKAQNDADVLGPIVKSLQ
jgi:hypothetical protein